MSFYRFSIKHCNYFTMKSRKFSSVLCAANIPIYKDNQQRSKKNMIKFLSPLENRRKMSTNERTLLQDPSFLQDISTSQFVRVLQDNLLYIYDYTGLPWWITIVSTTIILRTVVTLPLTIYQYYIFAKIENLKLELKDLVNELKREVGMAQKMLQLNEKQCAILFRTSMKKQWNKLIVRDNCHPFKGFLGILIQIPLWVCMSFAIRNIVYLQSIDPSLLSLSIEMSTGGFGWIPNLTEPDMSLIFPFMLGFTNLSIIEIQRIQRSHLLKEPSKFYNVITNISRGVSILMIPVAASVPSCLCLYWVVSSTYGLAQNLVLVSPKVRRKLGIPKAASEPENPYDLIGKEITRIASKITPTNK